MFKRKLAQFEQEIEARRAAGDRDGEVAARSKKALIHMFSFNIQANYIFCIAPYCGINADKYTSPIASFGRNTLLFCQLLFVKHVN